jgi:leader peptidase (prepilin peptidase)/N-methyltransferase
MVETHLLGVALAAVVGLAIGSFLNVVIHRLPKILEHQWTAECATLTGAAPPPQNELSLLTPRSRCPACGHQIRWLENFPLLSYALLRGKCSKCGTSISARYPAVEFACAALFAFCAWRWGLTFSALAWAGFCAALLALACIDWDTTFLPDDITLPLIWAGMLASVLQFTQVSLEASLLGAVGGYLSLWSVYWIFKFITGKEGMGYGDFKLFAALGSWFGWQALIPMILVASVLGALVGIGLKVSHRLREGGYVPFGPFLAGAGLLSLILGPQTVLRLVGL